MQQASSAIGGVVALVVALWVGLWAVGAPPRHAWGQQGQASPPAVANASAYLIAITPTPAPSSAVSPSTDYRYVAPPSISRATYISVWCDPPAGIPPSPACPDAGAMYDVLVDPGIGGERIDPAIEAGQAAHETALGTAGVGRADLKNLHGVQCHGGDQRIGDAPVAWGNGCAGIYASYVDAVRTWKMLILREYVAAGLLDVPAVVARYAPDGADGNCSRCYISAMTDLIAAIRQRESP
jgi:hypothetical protein